MAALGQEHLRQGDLENGYPAIATVATYGFDDFGGRAAKWNEILELAEEDSLILSFRVSWKQTFRAAGVTLPVTDRLDQIVQTDSQQE
ncbi:hypothetical protein V1508DRAFT_427829 [Lipomyces doorenjongii]|uniref:uncharacterized protein n=1 Tax=Lipomyces doorenjongii TaxID=383834 RepID=UPI0034CF10D5